MRVKNECGKWTVCVFWYHNLASHNYKSPHSSISAHYWQHIYSNINSLLMLNIRYNYCLLFWILCGAHSKKKEKRAFSKWQTLIWWAGFTPTLWHGPQLYISLSGNQTTTMRLLRNYVLFAKVWDFLGISSLKSVPRTLFQTLARYKHISEHTWTFSLHQTIKV